MSAQRPIVLAIVLALVLAQLTVPLRPAAALAAAATERLIVELDAAPAGVAKARAEAAGVPFDLAAYDAQLAADQDALVATLNARGISAQVATTTLTDAAGATQTGALRWTYVYNGLAVVVPSGSAAAIAALPGVRHVQGDTPVQAYLAESVPYINAPGAWGLGYRGEGQTIADIDTGIDWNHPMLTNTPGVPPGDLHPKVKFYLCLTAGACTDDFGHGTHVAGIAAGDKSLGYSATPVPGVEVEAGKSLYDGVAPKAPLWGYKVLATNGSGVTTSIVTAIDDAARRGAKVINLSLGSTTDDPESANSKSVDNAMKAGTVVAVAAGNSGPGYATVGTPGTARLALTVGAATDPGDDQFQAVDTTASPQKRMNMLLMSNSPRPPAAPAIQSLYVFVGEGCTPADYATRTPVSGRIALIARGTCTFTAKALLAQTQGAAAALIYNNVAGDFSGSMEKTNIPVAGISDTNGAYLRGFTDAASGLSTHTVLLDPNAAILAGRVTGFSSRGPTADYRIKPDVVAPGNAITSATSKVGVPTQSMADPSGYTTAGGTSMATPHVAGASAVIRQAHPAWTPFDVRLALMNTARQLIDPADGAPYSVQDQGAGLIDVLAAVTAKGQLFVRRTDLGATATEGSYSFGQVENYGGTITRTTTFTLRDLSGSARTYQLAFQPGDGKGRGGEGRALPAAGFTATLGGTSLTVPANGSASVTFSVTVDGSRLADGDYEGRLVATAPDQTLAAPVFYRAVHRKAAPFGAPVLSGPAESTNGTIPLSWTAPAAALGYRLQEARNPNTVIFRDDAESGLGKWTVGGTTPVAWTSSLLRANSPTHSFFAFQGSNQSDTLTLAQPVTIPAGMSASVSYATYVDTEPTFDFGYLEASRDGRSWTVIDRVDGFSNGWIQRTADLSSFAGGSALIRFRYASDLIFDIGLYEGWYVDDISISTADWATIAEPAGTSYTVSGRAAGTYSYRVAGLFDTPTVTRAQGRWSNTVAVVVKLPDLAIAPADIGVSQDRDTATITAVVHNIGSADATNVGVRFLWDNVQIGTDQTLARVAANGGTATATLAVNVRHQQGDHTVTVVVDPTNAITELREDNNSASKTVTVRGNRVRNGSFEQTNASGQPTDWTASGNTTANSDPATASDGTRSVSVTGNGTSGGSWTSAPISVSPGETLSLSVDVTGAGGTSAPRLGVNLLGATGAVTSTLAIATGAVGPLAGTLTVPAGVAQISVTLSGFAPTDLSPTGTVTFDNVLVY